MKNAPGQKCFVSTGSGWVALSVEQPGEGSASSPGDGHERERMKRENYCNTAAAADARKPGDCVENYARCMSGY